MEKLVWCLAVAVAVSGCTTPSVRYAALKEESLKARTLEEAVKASPPSEASVGQEIELDLEKSDDILLTSDGPYSSYVSYYRLYSFEAVAGKHYTVIVRSFCDCYCFGFQKLVVVPETYVVDGEGRLVSQVLQPIQMEKSFNLLFGLSPRLVGKWEFTAEKNGQYFLVLAANNSDPGQMVSVLEVDWYNQATKSMQKLALPLQSSTTGPMAFEIKAM